MPYRELGGNLFNSSADALVNTVNCVGAMGKGIALEFRRRFPAMFAEYKALCDEKKLKPGQIWPYKKSSPMVLNFAIKTDWHYPLEWKILDERTKKSTWRSVLEQLKSAFDTTDAHEGLFPAQSDKGS